ncbi:MAG TPA: hypothetical protein VD928_00400, partial [Candidatus Paceibacterota bacterium]|nr:hypothetical protein [Candidatus Paceibacterota bacterium]
MNSIEPENLIPSGYISAKIASERFGITNDYITRLARRKSVRGILIGRTWYLDESSLADFLHGKQVKKVEEAKYLSRIRLEEYERTDAARKRIEFRVTDLSFLHPEKIKPISAEAVAVTSTAISDPAVEHSVHKKAHAVSSRRFVAGAKVFFAASSLVFLLALSVSAARLNPQLLANVPVALEGSQVASPIFAKIFEFIFGAPKKARPYLAVQATPLFGSSENNTLSQKSAPGSNVAGAETQGKVAQTSSPVVQNVTRPVIERVIEKTVSGVSESMLTSKLQELSNTLRSEFFGLVNTPAPSFPSAGGPVNNIALTQRIDKLNGVLITNGTVNGLAGLTDADIPDGITVAGLTSSQWTTSGSDIYYSSGNVGIGTSSPANKLSIEGTTSGRVRSTIRNYHNEGLAQFTVNNDTDGYASLTTYGSSFSQAELVNAGQLATKGNLYLSANIDDSSGGSGSIFFTTGGWNYSETTRGVITRHGQVGFGTTSPLGILSVSTPTGSTGATTTLFVVASSTGSTNTTLFSISNTGTTTLGRFGSCDTTRALTTDSSGNIVCGAISGAGGSAGNWFTPTTNFGAAANSTSTPIW